MKKMVFGLLAITLPMFVSWVTMNLSHSHPDGVGEKGTKFAFYL